MAKARRQKLKVFRTPIGFHDAYVAAPSQKAALKAWGAGTDLFSSGAAEQVTDPRLMKAPLERPGEVIKVSRGDADEIAAPKKRSGSKAGSARRAKRSDRRDLEKAEAALAELAKRQRAELSAMTKEEERLARKRRDMERRHEAEHDEAAAVRDRARSTYERAVRQWERDTSP